MNGTDDVRGKRVTVAGLGRFGGGISVSKWLASQGATVLVTDKEPADKLAGSVAQLAGLPIRFRLGEHREEDFTDTDLVVTSPHYQVQRIEGVPNVFASPVAAAGKIFIVGREGTTAVIKPGASFEVLSTNALDDHFDASPALVDSELYLRGMKYLYSIGN